MFHHISFASLLHDAINHTEEAPYFSTTVEQVHVINSSMCIFSLGTRFFP